MSYSSLRAARLAVFSAPVYCIVLFLGQSVSDLSLVLRSQQMRGFPFTHNFFFFLFWYFEKRFHYIAQTGLEFKDLLMTASQMCLGLEVCACVPSRLSTCLCVWFIPASFWLLT